jgi:hypothetical protein
MKWFHIKDSVHAPDGRNISEATGTVLIQQTF